MAADLSQRCPTARTRRRRKSKAQFLIAIAESDDTKAPNDKVTLKDTFAKAGLLARKSKSMPVPRMAECPPDSQVYNEPLAEKAWSRLLALYGKALA